MERPDFFTLKNGEKVKLPFSKSEYDRRVNNLRTVMDQNNLDMVILTSMHNIAYYTGFKLFTLRSYSDFEKGSFTFSPFFNVKKSGLSI